MADRISTLDSGYISGDLSLFPKAVDTQDSLYQVANNATTFTMQGLTYNSNFIVVEDASAFPSSGLIKVGKEIVYYGSRTDTVFKNLVRGFSGSRQSPWLRGTTVSGSVMAEVHNAEKDAIVKIETDLGLENNPSNTSLNGILKVQENRFLAPQPLFRGFPIIGAPPLTVSFQNFSGGDPIRFLWDFGDGATSVERSPSHTYVVEGTYDVSLNMITALGAQGVITKKAYINVNHNKAAAFFYATPLVGTANSTTINFVDQTDGDVANRYWIFDDGTFDSETDPDNHTTTHIYTKAGMYNPALLVVFSDESKKKLSLGDTIIIK